MLFPKLPQSFGPARLVPRGRSMSHEIAKLMLENAGTFLAREEAVRSAMKLGMPLQEIEDYLDWLDTMRKVEGTPKKLPEEGDSSSA